MNEKKKLWRLPKRILSFVLTLALVFTLMPWMSMDVKAEDGTCGCGNHTYLIDGDTITINGSEPITSSCGFGDSSSVPQGKNVIIGDDITEVGNCAFEMCEIKSITFGSSVATIGDHICCANGELIVTFTSVVENIDEYAFSSCSEGTLNLPADWPDDDLPDEDGKWYGGKFPSYTPPTPPTKYEIILQNNGNGDADSSPRNGAVEGADVTITAMPDAGYVFDKWESSDITIPDTAGREYTFTMPAKNVTVKAVFKVAHTHDGITFDKKITAAGGALTAGNYYLDEDITLTSQIIIEGDYTVNLCLNGHVLNCNGIDEAIYVVNNATLNLYDCNASTVHKFSKNDSGRWIIDQDGSLSVTGGVITNGREAISIYLGERTATDATVNMYGGNICGNERGVRASKGSHFNMYGGSICGNYATDGAGIYGSEGSDIKIAGGQIRNNTAADKGQCH